MYFHSKSFLVCYVLLSPSWKGGNQFKKNIMLSYSSAAAYLLLILLRCCHISVLFLIIDFFFVLVHEISLIDEFIA